MLLTSLFLKDQLALVLLDQRGQQDRLDLLELVLLDLRDRLEQQEH